MYEEKLEGSVVKCFCSAVVRHLNYNEHTKACLAFCVYVCVCV